MIRLNHRAAMKAPPQAVRMSRKLLREAGSKVMAYSVAAL
jgi:hypothetical protein